jgi:Short C-terminal domain
MPPTVVRRGPGLIRAMARIAAIAGTATVVSDALIDHQVDKQQPTAADTTGLDDHQGIAGARAPQAEAAMASDTAAAAAANSAGPAAATTSDLAAQLKQLADLKAAGVLSDGEFEAAKAKLLGG